MVAGADVHAVGRHDLADVVRVHAVDRKCDDAVVILRLVRAEHVHMRDGQHTREGVDRQVMFALLDGVEADALHIPDGSSQTGCTGSVDRAGLKFMRQFGIDGARARDGFDHLAAGEKRRHFLEQVFPAVQPADAHGTKDLVAGEGEEIRAQLLHVHRHVRRALRAVYDHDRALFVRHGGDLLHRVLPAEDVRHLRHRDDLCAPADERFDLLKIHAAIRRALDKLQLRARLAADHLPRQQIAVVLHDGHEHLIARLDVRQAVAIGDEIQALGRVAGKDDLARRLCADEAAHRLARLLINIGRLDAQRIQAAQGVRVVTAVEICHCIKHALRALGRGRVVDIGDVRMLKDREVIFVVIRHR